MTQAANLGALGTNVNSSGDVSLTTGVTETLPAANGGTGTTAFPSPGSNGNVLTSNGTAWTSAAAAAGYVGPNAQVFSSNGTFTIPSGITKVKVTVVGGGGGGGSATNDENRAGGGGGGGATAIKWLTSLTSGGTLAVTIGGGGAASSSGGTSTVASGTQSITTLTSTGGNGGSTNDPAAIAVGGTATNGDINIRGGNSFWGQFGQGGGGGGSFFSTQNCGPQSSNPTFNGYAGYGPGGGGSGAGSYPGTSNKTGGTGAAGIVVFEW
jgi:hypothetical protein